MPGLTTRETCELPYHRRGVKNGADLEKRRGGALVMTPVFKFSRRLLAWSHNN